MGLKIIIGPQFFFNARVIILGGWGRFETKKCLEKWENNEYKFFQCFFLENLIYLETNNLKPITEIIRGNCENMEKSDLIDFSADPKRHTRTHVIPSENCKAKNCVKAYCKAAGLGSTYACGLLSRRPDPTGATNSRCNGTSRDCIWENWGWW